MRVAVLCTITLFTILPLSGCGNDRLAKEHAARRAELQTKLEEANRAKEELERETKEAKRQADEAKRKADHEAALTEGDAAMKQGHYEQAFTVFSRAVDLAPEDKETLHRRVAAELALRLQQGRTALAEKRYDDAIKAYTTATELSPDDRSNRELLQKAKEAHLRHRKAARDRAMTAGRSSARAKRYEVALTSFREALRWMPGDAVAEKAAREAEYQVQLDSGRKALEAKRHADAIAALEAAGRLRPGDGPSAALLRQARDAKQKQDKADHDRAMSAGRAALAAGRLDDAIRAFSEARKLVPSSAEAAGQLQEAERKKQDYQSALSRARTALSLGRFDEAIRVAREAERLNGSGLEAGNLRRDAEMKKREAEMKKLPGRR